MVAMAIATLVGYNKGYEVGLKSFKDPKPTVNDNPTITTDLYSHWKTNKDDEDLILNHHYTATIDGTKVSIPVETKKIKGTLESPSASIPSTHTSSSTSATPVTTHIDQQIDLTPLFKSYEKKRVWEIGTGIGRQRDEWYVPIEVQRNFGSNKAVSFQVNVTDKEIVGYQATYKIRF